MRAPQAWIAHLSHQAGHAPTDAKRERFLVAFLATMWATWDQDKTPALERMLGEKLQYLYLQLWDEASPWHTRFFGHSLDHLRPQRDDALLERVLNDMEPDLAQAQPGHLDAAR